LGSSNLPSPESAASDHPDSPPLDLP
jgi:hypothetical protein